MFYVLAVLGGMVVGGLLVAAYIWYQFAKAMGGLFG